ncbi:MFS transporter [Pseudarthrobacter sp. YAF2]|uniref:MFS transporter n=1 Tax=Pseudarthrobacter sp. YAF2 TaxID=3233078 RepID=UPI003F9C58C8
MKFRAIASLGNPGFRLFWLGQLASNIGTWFQNLALSLVVLDITGSAWTLALVTVAQFAPVFLLSTAAGYVADKARPRTVLLWTSSCSGVVIGLLCLAASQDNPSLAVIYCLLGLSGCIQAFERPAAQGFTYELVGSHYLQNAVALMTVAVSSARSVGPAAAGLAYISWGPVACLAINACSYFLILAALLFIRTTALICRTSVGTGLGPESLLGQLRASPALRQLLLVAAIITLTAINFTVSVTSTVTITFAGSAVSVGLAHALNAVGAIVGGLIASSSRGRMQASSLGLPCTALAVTLMLSATAPSLELFLVYAPLLGLGLGLYQGVLYSAAQASSPPEFLGRVMSLFTMATFGLSPLSALLAGFLTDISSSRTPLFVGACGCALCAAVVFWRRAGRPGS